MRARVPCAEDTTCAEAAAAPVQQLQLVPGRAAAAVQLVHHALQYAAAALQQRRPPLLPAAVPAGLRQQGGVHPPHAWVVAVIMTSDRSLVSMPGRNAALPVVLDNQIKPL